MRCGHMNPYVSLTVCALLGLWSWQAAAQNNRPVDKRGFFKVLRDRSLPADELTQIVKERGVDFSISADEEKEVLTLGGDAGLVEAIRASLKAAPKPVEVKLPDGPPLGQKEVLLLLEAQVDQDNIRKLIEKRGTAFTLDKATAIQMSAAGANSAVIGTLLISQREAPKPVVAAPPPEPVRQVAQAMPPPTLQPQNPTPQVPAVSTPSPAKPVTPPAAAPASAPQQPIRVDVFSQAQKLKSTVKPQYPIAAQRMKVQGRVAVEVLISKDGVPQNTHTVSGHPQLARAAEDAVKKWRWEPTLVNGQAVEVISQVVMDFKISSN